MDAITLLRHDHEEVEQLFRQFEKLTERAHRSKEKIVAKVTRELAIHSAIEEMLFYPAVRTAALKANVRTLKEAGDTVLESLEEHHLVKWTLTELEKMKPEDERYDAKFKVLMESVRHHVEEEQDELFPKARRLLGKDMLEELGERMEKAKKLAPTRPHPRAPDEPPGNLVAGTVAAVMDRAKDMVRDSVDRLSKRRSQEADA
ncbi:MAG TPA: hemerythrin domain-containing protein [Myxococcales bacterium]|nr:hemerythrin domain-containing protein [Myxococcales bacterium]